MLDLTVQGRRAAEASAPGEALERNATAPGLGLPLHGLGLAARVLAVTIGFVFLAMGLFYVTRLIAHREMWLHGKISAAQTTVAAFGLAGPNPPSQELAQKILHSVDVKWLAVDTPTGRREFVLGGGPPVGAEPITADDSSWLESLSATFQAVFAAPHTIAKLSAPAQGDQPAIEFAFDEQPLIHSLRRVSGNFLAISLTIAAVVTCVLWAALWRMVLWPVRRLTSNIIAFGESPQDATRVITPSGRGSEIGRAEAALAVMQRSLAHELAQGKRLAELGMAVARINHDLRNMLSAAQLISDRLAAIPDPLAQRLAPRLVATLDRAIQFCQATLTYGAARELPPLRRRFDLSELVGQVVESATAENDAAIDYNIDIPPRFCVYADPDHTLRVLENLSRNAAQALLAKGAIDGRPKAIRFAAIRTDGLALIEVSDTGPGFPADQSERIFEPFHKSTSDAGAGLGLAIAADLVTRNGGAIALAPARTDDFYCGARFLIKLPTAEAAARKPARILPDSSELLP
ncbi:MAG TPA: HAMP domain-containing sensor histidine kinase [Roseiarcus sp.]|jgi:signal transduction histidine kinase